MSAPIRVNAPNAAISATTIVAPTGVLNRIEAIIPQNAQTTEMQAEHSVTDLKLLNTRIADRAGKITSAEISSEPTSVMATTMTTAMMTAMIRFIRLTLVPVARAKLSSKVTAKILL